MEITYLTQEKYDELKALADDLKTNGRLECTKAIAEARDKGDLSENAEYDAAKDAQGLLELRINKLDVALLNARIIDLSQLDISKVVVFSKVTIRNTKNNKEFIYQLVSEVESSIKEKKISVTSPIGSSLLGKVIGDLVEVETPRGAMQFEILDISL